MPVWTIVCDFDGTIVADDVIDALLQRFGRTGWERMEMDWRAGRIGSRECMSGQVGLLDMDHVQLDECLAGFCVDPSFRAFVDTAKASGVSVNIASDGLDYAISSILDGHGIHDVPFAANHLLSTGPRCWQLTSPYSQPNCQSGTCKCAVAERMRDTGGQVLLIGDGASDFCAAQHADLVFSKHKLTQFCRDNYVAHVPVANFEDATDALLLLLDNAMPSPVDQVADTSRRIF